jgi:hypothetical protein
VTLEPNKVHLSLVAAKNLADVDELDKLGISFGETMEESARELDEGLDSQLFSSRTLHGTSKKIITMHDAC